MFWNWKKDFPLLGEPKKRNVQKFSVSQSFKYLSTKFHNIFERCCQSFIQVGNFSSKRKNFHALKERNDWSRRLDFLWWFDISLIEDVIT